MTTLQFLLASTLLALFVAAAPAGETGGATPEFDIAHAPAPLFRDPVFDGAADPTVVYNDADHTWTIFYTQRRANIPSPGVAWCFGTRIGTAVSHDNGRTWTYGGTADGVTIDGELDTFWAPCVVKAGSTWHMYVAHMRGISSSWGLPAHIAHFSSPDLAHWKYVSTLDLGSDHVIDPGVIQLPGGKWLMYFKDESNHSLTSIAESQDLDHWQRVPNLAVGSRHHEAPVPFRWHDHYWLVVDEWRGLGVYRSDDAYHWTWDGLLLDHPGRRRDDTAFGSHADVVVSGDRAFVFYFTHPDRAHAPHFDPTTNAAESYGFKRSSLQVAELEYRDGHLACDRDRYAPATRPTTAPTGP